MTPDKHNLILPTLLMQSSLSSIFFYFEIQKWQLEFTQEIGYVLAYPKLSVGYLQGVPKVRSSNFMHYNCWSKLYFYVKFLEDVYFSVKYMCSEFQ